VSNEVDDKKIIENDSAQLNDYEIEVDMPERKGFFAKIIDKIKGNNDTKLLESGNKETFQKTNRSISSMWTVASLRRTVMEKLETLNRSLFRTPERVDQSNITTHVVGRDDINKDSFTQETEKESTFEPIIPISKSPAQVMKKEPIIPKAIVGNVRTAESIKAEKEEQKNLEVETLDIEEEAIDKNIDSKIEEKAPISSIEAGDINIGTITKETNERESGDERE
jgi:hypothetical protein